VLLPESLVVRAAVRGDPSCDRLTEADREYGLRMNAATALAYFRTLGELDLTECMR